MIKERIERLMQERGWKVQQLAFHAGISDAAVYNILNGTDPRLSTVLRIARAFRIGLNELVAQEEIDQAIDELRNKSESLVSVAA